MSHYEKTAQHWNQLAALYEEKFMHLDLYNASYDIFCNQLKKPDAALLEIGCGPGNITRHLLSQRPDLRIHATDVAPSMLARAQENNPGITAEVLDARDVYRLEKTFDGIVCGFVIAYLLPEDTEKFISSLPDLLRDDGLLYLSFTEGDPARSGPLLNSQGDRMHFEFYRTAEIIDLLTRYHLSPAEILHIPYPRNGETETHTVIIARKNNST